jgi:hypothetical protein
MMPATRLISGIRIWELLNGMKIFINDMEIDGIGGTKAPRLHSNFAYTARSSYMLLTSLPLISPPPLTNSFLF